MRFPSPVFAPEGPKGGGSPPASSPSTPSSASSPPTSSGAASSSGASSTPTSSEPSPPAAAPTPGGTSQEPSAPGGEGFDFSAIFTNDGDTSSPASEPVIAAPVATAPTAPTPPVAPPGVEPAATPPAVAAQAEPVAPPSAPSPQEPASSAPQGAPALDPTDPVALATALAENEQAAIDHVAQSTFRLAPEEIEALETNPVEAIPKLLAKAFVKTQLNILQQMGKLVPAMVQRQTEATRRNDENLEKFFARWTDLNPAAHKALTMRYATTYRQMHPQATLEQMIEDLGPMVMMAARVVPGSAALKPSVPVAPTTNGVRPPQPPAFVPAMGGPAAQAQPAELAPWETMFQQEE